MQEIPPHQVGKLWNIRIIGNFIVSARAWLHPSTRTQCTKSILALYKFCSEKTDYSAIPTFSSFARIYSNSSVFGASVCVCVQSIVHQLKMVESNKIIVLSICHKLNETPTPSLPPAAGKWKLLSLMTELKRGGGDVRALALEICQMQILPARTGCNIGRNNSANIRFTDLH